MSTLTPASSGPPVRSAPPGSAASVRGTPLMAVRELRGLLTNYCRTWRGSIISSVLAPLLSLVALGMSLGKIVDAGPGAHSFGTVDGEPVSYLLFLAPALLANTAMQTAIGESTYPVMSSMKWQKTFHASIASPLGSFDVFVGRLLFVGFRVLMNCAIFLAVMALFGAVHAAGPGGLGPVLAVPAAALTGLAFAAPVIAWAVTQDRDTGFSVVFRFVMIPLFLFSGTFFPVTQLPAAIRPLAYATPLWHGVDLCRGLALGTASAGSVLLHLAYLFAVIGAGLWYGAHTFRRRLNP
ncbi:ABC-2 type transporter [Catenulispora acidiphila DSM 44928]|uniref:Transport permease protein n=1 Tax=Catenulispora acidiphila (strain DSM 44928 / JCM 14897 / NBRC 102108 / NRRL B-24433 / ID139908) TaxID=479433 RepID=C7QD14_CATAD|nr:ABC transporter permease [Catenulispora acidiphila]ACU70724.1 ABC-2 type transporter [Catenulispora acidiphila DSM 44928]